MLKDDLIGHLKHKWPHFLIGAIYSALYIIPFFFATQLPEVTPDEYRAIELANRFWDNLLNRFEFSTTGMNPYTGSLYYYLLIPFLKILGETSLTLRFVSSLFMALNLKLLFDIFQKKYESRSVLIILCVLLAHPYWVSYGRVAIEVSSLVPFLLLLFYKFLIEDKLHLASALAALSVWVHPIAIPYVLFAAVIKGKAFPLKKGFTILIPWIFLIINKAFLFNQISETSRSSQLYLGWGKIADFILHHLDFIDGHKILYATVGQDSVVALNYLPLLVFVVAIILSRSSMKQSLKSKRLLIGLLLYTSIMILIIPALHFQYFAYMGSLLLFWVLLQIKSKRWIVYPLIALNLINSGLNHHYQYLKTGGVGSFYDHAYFDQGVTDRKPYHNFYYLNYAPTFEKLVQSQTKVMTTNDWFMLNLLNFYARKYKGFKVAHLSQLSREMLEEPRITLLTFAYSKDLGEIKLPNNTMTLDPQNLFDNKKIHVYY